MATLAKQHSLREDVMVAEMSRALGLKSPQLKNHHNTRTAVTSGLVIVISVRLSGMGNPIPFLFCSKTLSRLEAVMTAEREARKLNYTPHVLLWVGDSLDDIPDSYKERALRPTLQ